MPRTPPVTDHAQKVRAGRLGALARWGPERRTAPRLDTLDPAVRRAVIALIEADRESKRLAAETED